MGNTMKPRLAIVTLIVSIIIAVPIASSITTHTHVLADQQAQSVALKVKLAAEKQAKFEQAQQLAAAKTAADQKAAADAATAKQAAYIAHLTVPDCAGYEPLVAKYNWPVKTAMAIMQAESGCRAITPSNAAINYDGVSDYGLFQLHGMNITDPAANVEAAYTIKYLPTHTFNAWNTYTGGQYRAYLQ